jgi:hypothetical protein
MTRDWWETTHFPIPLLGFLADNRSITPRKARLFACAACRMARGKSHRPDLTECVEAAEQFADGRETPVGLRIAHITARNFCEQEPDNLLAQLAFHATESDIHVVTIAVLLFDRFQHRDMNSLHLTTTDVNRIIADLIRELFPLHDEPFDPNWRTAAILDMAGQLDDMRNDTALPVLADALEEAGCNNKDLLAHCRDPQAKHVRGCWAVDLVLGKT